LWDYDQPDQECLLGIALSIDSREGNATVNSVKEWLVFQVKSTECATWNSLRKANDSVGVDGRAASKWSSVYWSWGRKSRDSKTQKGCLDGKDINHIVNIFLMEVIEDETNDLQLKSITYGKEWILILGVLI